MDELTIDEYGFVRLSKLCICRITNDGRLEFRDGAKRRSRQRGSHYVYTTPEALYRFIIAALIEATIKVKTHESIATHCPTAQAD